jgi:Transposase DDE domain
MRHIVDPRQERLFDPYQGLFPPIAIQILGQGWQAVFRHVILELLPVGKLAQHFHPSTGAPTKELYSMAGLVFLADFHGWTTQQAIEAYIFRTDVQYALNVQPGVQVCTRTVERYQKLFREDDLAAEVFGKVTAGLTEKLEIDVSRQRLDSTHLFSHMATFGRTRLMAVAIKRFLTQVKRHAPELYAPLPEELRRRYEPVQSQLFADATTAEARQRSRQQAAEDLLWIIEHFADQPGMTSRPTYKVLQTIFSQQCEVVEGKVTVRAKTGGNCIQNPSDPDATYDGHKGPGYQVQIAETCSPENEVQLITGAIPQTACESDDAAVVPMLDQLKEAKLLPEEMLADTIYASDDNVQAAEKHGVELIGPIPGRTPESDPEALTVDDFAIDERTGVVDACPAGHQPLSCTRDDEAGKTKVEMPAEICGGCAFRTQCPIGKTRQGRFVIEFTDKEHRLAGRRREQATDVFKKRYAKRAGIESTNSGLKNRLGLGKLPVRGKGSVFRVVFHKLAGWNVLRAAASQKLRAWVSEKVARALKTSENGCFGRLYGPTTRPRGHCGLILSLPGLSSHRHPSSRAA